MKWNEEGNKKNNKLYGKSLSFYVCVLFFLNWCGIKFMFYVPCRCVHSIYWHLFLFPSIPSSGLLVGLLLPFHTLTLSLSLALYVTVLGVSYAYTRKLFHFENDLWSMWNYAKVCESVCVIVIVVVAVVKMNCVQNLPSGYWKIEFECILFKIFL